MRRKSYKDERFVSPNYAAECTGMSVKRIREGCKDKTIPCVRVGRDFRVELAEYLEQLHREAAVRA